MTIKYCTDCNWWKCGNGFEEDGYCILEGSFYQPCIGKNQWEGDEE